MSLLVSTCRLTMEVHVYCNKWKTLLRSLDKDFSLVMVPFSQTLDLLAIILVRSLLVAGSYACCVDAVPLQHSKILICAKLCKMLHDICPCLLRYVGSSVFLLTFNFVLVIFFLTFQPNFLLCQTHTVLKHEGKVIGCSTTNRTH